VVRTNKLEGAWDEISRAFSRKLYQKVPTFQLFRIELRSLVFFFFNSPENLIFWSFLRVRESDIGHLFLYFPLKIDTLLPTDVYLDTLNAVI
jgi:hypothetical protein